MSGFESMGGVKVGECAGCEERRGLAWWVAGLGACCRECAALLMEADIRKAMEARDDLAARLREIREERGEG